MAAGILSAAAREQKDQLLSNVLLLLAAVAFVMAVARNGRAIAVGVDRGSAMPTLILFTWVAGCGVLSRQLDTLLPFAGSAFALLAAAGLIAALIFLGLAQRTTDPPHAWNVTGSWLLAVVALQSLSIVCGAAGSGPFAACAVGLWVIGIATYGFLIALIIRRLVRRHIGVEEMTPDYWIALGALAISTVAASEVHPLARFAFAVWLVAAAWLPFLCVMEAMRLATRGLEVRYDLLRWSTVFPLGMFSVASHVLGVSALYPVAAAFLWVGLAIATWNLLAGVWNPRRHPAR